RILARTMDRGVDDEARGIDRIGTGADRPAVDIDLDEIRRRHLAIGEAERVDQEMPLRPRHAHGDVVENHLDPAEMIEDAVARREIDPELPLRRAEPLALPFELRRHHAHSSCPENRQGAKIIAVKCHHAEAISDALGDLAVLRQSMPARYGDIVIAWVSPAA